MRHLQQASVRNKDVPTRTGPSPPDGGGSDVLRDTATALGAAASGPLSPAGRPRARLAVSPGSRLGSRASLQV